MKLTGALLSIMQMVAVFVPHTKTSAVAITIDGAKIVHEVAFRRDISFVANEGEFISAIFAVQLENVRKEIARILLNIIPSNILSETMVTYITEMDKVELLVWYGSDDEIEDATLVAWRNGKYRELTIEDETTIEIFPKVLWESLNSTLGHFNHGVMTERGPCYKVE